MFDDQPITYVKPKSKLVPSLAGLLKILLFTMKSSFQALFEDTLN